MKRYALAALSLTAAFGLMACGDETTTNNFTSTEIEDILAKKLPNCEKDIQGKIYFVSDLQELQICMDGDWMTLNGEDGAKGEKGEKGDQGDKGDTGKPGDKGKNGDNCEAKALKDSSGYKILCGGDSVGVVLNGKKGEPGEPGKPGKDGVSCQMTVYTDKGDTAAKVTCKDTTVYLFHGKDAEATGTGDNSGTDTGDIEGPQTTLSEGSMPNGLVIIGNQVWAGQNLNDATKGGHCINNEEENCATFGRLYTWAEAMNLDASYNQTTAGATTTKKNYQGICPEGYHIPTGNDWANLSAYVNSHSAATAVRVTNDYIESADVAGILLRGTTYDGNDNAIWTTRSGTVPATDFFGFMAVGAGYAGPEEECEYDASKDEDVCTVVYKNFSSILSLARFWTPVETADWEDEWVYVTNMTADASGMAIDAEIEKETLASVRCMMNMTAEQYKETEEYKALFTSNK